MASRKGDIIASGESQKQTLAAAKTKQKKISNASDSLPGPINLTKKSVKKTAVTQKTLKLEQKNAKTAKIIKKIEKEIEDLDEKKDFVKKSAKQKLKDKLVTKPVKKLVKEIVKKEKNCGSGSTEKSPPKLKKSMVKKFDDKEDKKPKEKVQKEKKFKEIKKKSPSKAVKKGVEKSIDDIGSIKARVDVKTDKKDKPKKAKVIAKSKLKLNSAKKIEDNPPIECMDVKEENQDDVALLQVFQLKNGPVCEFDANVCNTITIRQDNTCIKIKEISVSQLPYSVKTEEKADVTSMPLKKESKQITAEIQNTEKQVAEKQKNEKPKVEKQKAEKLKNVKKKSEKPKTEKQKTVKLKIEKQKVEKQKIIEGKPVKKSAKAEKIKKPVLVVDKIKPKGKTKITQKVNKVKGRPAVSKRPRVASLNAIAKVHCLYENESKSALIDAMVASTASAVAVPSATKGMKDQHESDAELPARKGKRTSKRTTPGLKSVGRHWDMHDTSSTNSSSSGVDDVKYEPPKSAKRTKKQPVVTELASTDDDNEEEEEEEEVVKSPKEVSSPTGGSSKRKRRNADNVTMDLKDMVVKKRMASLNASAILAASYSTEKKLPPKGAGQESSKKSSASSEASSERSEPEDDAEDEDSDGHRESSIRPAAAVVHPTPLPPIVPPPSSQLAVIVNQDTDVTITTGVYVNSTTRSTMHEEFCTISGLQYRISSTSHTQTEAVATETLLHADHSVSQQPPPSVSTVQSSQQPAAPRPSYAPLTALSSMKPPGSSVPGPGPGHGPEHHPGPPHPRRHPHHPHQHHQQHHHHHHHQYNSAFSAPPQPLPAHGQANGGVSSDASDNNGGKHHELQPAPLPPPAPPPYAHGYYQPAGPLITHHLVPHHVHLHHPSHVKPSPLVQAPPLVPTPPSSAGTTAAPPPAESSDTEVVPVRSTSAPTPPGYGRYPPPQGSYHPPQLPSYYPSPPASASLQYPAPPPPQVPAHYLPEPPPNPCGAYPGGPHHQPGYFHHSRSSPYHHIPFHHRRPPVAPPYVPAGAAPPTYYHEYYGPPPPPGPPPAPTGSPAHQQQQMLVAARPGDRPDHHQPPPLQQHPHPQHHQQPLPPPPPDVYPAPQPLYYSPYGAPPGPSCYSAAPPRTYIDPTYHSCPCPMQSCPNPKNVHTGPLTGAVSKGPKHHSTVVTLPPVALALPQEPPRAHGPPSPARGSAGVPGPPRSASSGSPSKQVPWCLSPLSPARASVQHLAPQSPAMLAAKNPTSEWNTCTEEKCDTTGLLAIGKVFSQSVIGLDHQSIDQHHDIVPKIEPIDDELSQTYYNLKVGMASENDDGSASEVDNDDDHQTIDLSTKPRERLEAITTVCCNTPVNNNNNNNISVNNNNSDGEKIVKGSAKRKKPNPVQIVLAKKLKKIQEENEDVSGSSEVTAAIIVDETKENKVESTAVTAITLLTVAGDDEPIVNRKNSIKSITDVRSEQEKLEESLTEEILRSVLTDDSDGDEMITEAFVKKKGMAKKTKKGRKDRKNGGNKKEMTDAMKRELEQRMREEFAQRSRLKNQELTPRWSNGWMWHGKPFKRPVYLENEDTPVLRKCYPCMRHMQGDTIYARDCVLLKSGSRKNDLPFIAKIANLWEDPGTGEMMMSLLWYYRPEHTKQGRQKEDMPDELFASKHRDVNSVACIDDRCYVLTFNEYCRHRKHAKSVQENLTLCKAVVPTLQESNPRARQLPVNGAPSELIFFCRRVYDCRQKRLLKKPSPL